MQWAMLFLNVQEEEGTKLLKETGVKLEKLHLKKNNSDPFLLLLVFVFNKSLQGT